MVDYASVASDYDAQIQAMEIQDDWTEKIDFIARRIITNKARYQAVSDALSPKDNSRAIPWQFIGCIHYRESDFDFRTHLHNGDSLNDRTHHVPAGRPTEGEPPFTWLESACDALEMSGLHKVKEWPLSRVAYELERYNGFGYRTHNVPSAYLWSGTSIYTGGKFVSDGSFDASVFDKQAGTMPILKRVLELDVSADKIVSGSRKLTWLTQAKATAVTLYGSYFTADNLNVIPDYVTKFKALGIGFQGWALIATGIAVWVLFSIVERMHVGDYAAGRYTPSKLVENTIDPTIKL